MIISLDIETLKIAREKWAELKGIEFPSKNEKALDESENELLEKEYQKSVFDATYSHIICIGIFVFDNGMVPKAALAWYGDNEAEILRLFWDYISAEKPKLIITFNGLGFDLPFIKKRSVIHNIKPTMEISLARFRERPIYDVMAIWANWETRGYTKLNTLARVLGVETKTGSGVEVSETWASGKRREVAKYCLKDVYVTYACYCRLNFQELRSSSVFLQLETLQEVN